MEAVVGTKGPDRAAKGATAASRAAGAVDDLGRLADDVARLGDDAARAATAGADDAARATASAADDAARAGNDGVRIVGPARAHLDHLDDAVAAMKGPRYGMTDAELAALYAYTLETPSFYRPANAALRGLEPMTPEIGAFVDDATRALDRLPTYDGTVYRGIDLPESVGAKYQPGATVTEGGFTSTSTHTPFPKQYQFEIRNTSTGRPIDRYSALPGEGEVLFKPGTAFRVVERTELPDGTVRIVQEQVAN